MAAFQWGLFGETALDFLEDSTARINIAEGAVSSGKTVSSIVRWLEFVGQAPPGSLLMAAKTERTLKRNILDPLALMLGPRYFRHDRSGGEVYLAGRRIYIAGANDERAQDRIRGLTLVGAYGDEVTLWPESFFKMLLSRLRVRDAKFFGTTNPDSPYHWLKRDYLDREGDLDLKRFRFGLDDNPNLDPEYVAAIKAEYTGLWHKRFVQGLWVVAEGLVYDMFDESAHVVSRLPESFEKVVVGVDYGTSSVTAFVALGLYRGTWYAFAEHYYDPRENERQKTDVEHAKDLREFLARGASQASAFPSSVELDPSAASFKAQLRRDGVQRVREADNAVLDGIRVVARALGAGRLLVHRSCRRLIGEFYNYSWDEKAQEKGEDRPLKVEDHALDALRYAAVKGIGRPQLKVLKKPKGA